MFYAVAFTVIGVVVTGLATIVPRHWWDDVLVFLLLFLGAFLAASLQGQIISDVAAVILAIGIATEGTRRYHERRERLARTLARAVPILSAAVLGAALLTIGARTVMEAVRLARLPAVTRGAPNVVLVVMDAQRADHLSLYG